MIKVNHRELLRAMVGRYYRERGYTAEGLLDDAALGRPGLRALAPRPRPAAAADP